MLLSGCHESALQIGPSGNRAATATPGNRKSTDDSFVGSPRRSCAGKTI